MRHERRAAPVVSIVLFGLCLTLMIGTADAAIPTSEREALIALYWSTNGDSWSNSYGWLGPAGSECGWYGVTCDGSFSTVTRLSLIYSRLSGVLPPEIGDLTNLEMLSLGGNRITGGIPPEIGNLTSLKLLYLHENRFTDTIPPEIGQLGALTNLYVRDNQFTGTIPPEIGQLANLIDLDVRDNQLSGPIPPELGNLAVVQSIDFGGNELTGTVPPELGQISTLETLYLFDNQLTGPIPPEIGNLTTLEALYLGGNRLTGSIPSQLGNLTTLEYLSLSWNKLSGSIPPELGNLGSLRSLYLNNNELSGPITPGLGNLTGNTRGIDLSSNLLAGEIPAEVANLCPRSLDLTYNALHASDPSVAAALESCYPDWRYQGAPPTDVEILAVSPRFVTIRWTPILWIEDGNYEVLASRSPGGPHVRLPSTAIAFDKGIATAIAGPLEADTTYSLVVRSINHPVVSSFSAEVIIATPRAATTFASLTGSDSNDCLSPATPCRTIQAAADKAAEGGKVNVGPGIFAENLVIDTPLVIEGSPDAPTIIDGQALGSVVSIGSGLPVALVRLGITNGEAQQGGGVFNGGGTVFVLESEITANLAIADGGAIHNHGGIVIVENSAIVQNTSGSDVVISRPPGEVEPGRAVFRNSTISGNVSTDVFSRVMAPVTLMHSTVVENQAGDQGYIIESTGSLFLHTIIAENLSPSCGYRQWLVRAESLGHNLADTADCIYDDEDGADIVVADVMIEGLGDNGGPTRTHALSPGSPAIDTGDSRGAPPLDQRGAFRPMDGDGDGFAQTDIGAFEHGSVIEPVFEDGFETGDSSRWSFAIPPPPRGTTGGWSVRR